MEKELLKDIINWDIVNWSKAINYWEKNLDFKAKPIGLELGAREGGLSLWLAMNGCTMICSDLESPEKSAFEVHKKYPCNNLIKYAAIDATNIGYKDYFDVIAFKSILGGIGRNDSIDLKQQTINEIHKA